VVTYGIVDALDARMTNLSIEQLATVTGGAGIGNTLRAGAVAGMGLVTQETGPSFPVLSPGGQTTSQGGTIPRAPFQPLALPGGGTATFGQ
jgi:hypothetical protein